MSKLLPIFKPYTDDVLVVLVPSPVMLMAPVPLVLMSAPKSQVAKSLLPATPLVPQLPDKLMLPPPALMTEREPLIAPIEIALSAADV